MDESSLFFWCKISHCFENFCQNLYDLLISKSRKKFKKVLEIFQIFSTWVITWVRFYFKPVQKKVHYHSIFVINWVHPVLTPSFSFFLKEWENHEFFWWRVHPHLHTSLSFFSWAPPLLLRIFSLLLHVLLLIYFLSLSQTLCIKCCFVPRCNKKIYGCDIWWVAAKVEGDYSRCCTGRSSENICCSSGGTHEREERGGVKTGWNSVYHPKKNLVH